jgi:hypothetical protein
VKVTRIDSFPTKWTHKRHLPTLLNKLHRRRYRAVPALSGLPGLCLPEITHDNRRQEEEYYTKRKLSTWSTQRGWPIPLPCKGRRFSRMKYPLVRRYGSGDRLNKSSAPFAKPAKRCPSTGSRPTAPMIRSARREAWWCVRCSSRNPLGSGKRNRLARLSHPPSVVQQLPSLLGGRSRQRHLISRSEFVNQLSGRFVFQRNMALPLSQGCPLVVTACLHVPVRVTAVRIARIRSWLWGPKYQGITNSVSAARDLIR